MNTHIDYNIDRVIEDASLNGVPIAATIELVTICNWRCKHCYIPEHNCNGMSYEKIINLINELRELGVYQLILTGGELFMRKDALSIIEYARNIHMRVNILSNATLINEKIAKRLSEIYITDYSLTIFSLDENIHDKITGVKGSLKKAMNGIELLDKYNIPIEVKTPLLSENYKDYTEIKEFCNLRNFAFSTSPCIAPKTNGNMDHFNYNITHNQLDDIIVDIDRIVEYKTSKNMPEYMCETLLHSLSISSNGDVFPCNGLYIKVGNINNSSLNSIWNSLKYFNLRKLKNIDSHECLECDISLFCDRCVGIVYSERSDLYGCSAICKDIAIARNNNYDREVK